MRVGAVVEALQGVAKGGARGYGNRGDRVRVARRPLQGGALGWSRERSACRAERGLGTAPRPRALGRPSRAWGVHLTRHSWQICRVVGDIIVLPPGRPVSLKTGTQIQIQTHNPPPHTPPQILLPPPKKTPHTHPTHTHPTHTPHTHPFRARSARPIPAPVRLPHSLRSLERHAIVHR